MKALRPILFLILSLYIRLAANAGEAPASSGKVDVKVTGLRSNSGEVRVNLYNSRDGFPSNPQKAMRTLVSKIENNEAAVSFNEIPFGEYAISVLHDENNNRKMDLNWLMVPKEGVGASNNPKGAFGPPGFNDARFQVDSEEVKIDIKVIY